MMLEIKHLAPYLPYGLKYLKIKNNEIETMKCISEGINMVDFGWGDALSFNEIKPILRPLSDFDKIENDLYLSTDFESSYYGNNNEVIFTNTSDKNYLTDIINVSSFMFENHFDVFGLINQGLAIDINTLPHGS